MLSTRAKVIAATILWIGFSVSRLRAQTDPNPLQGSPQQLVTPNQQVVSENAHSLEPGADPENRVGLPLIEHFAQDQQGFWLAPTHLRTKDLRWIMPGVVGLSALFASDHWISQQVPDKPNQLKQSLNVSDYMAYSMAAAAGGAFVWGHITKNERLRETGFLSGEAAINALAVSQVFKFTTQRPRPLVGDGKGTFFQGGNSFPSDHSALAWSVASVVAHEYPGPLTKFLAYGMATAVTMTRVTSKEHFTSDAVVGSLLGWYFGRQVYRSHHDPRLGGSAWSDPWDNRAESGSRPPSKGSPYVPIDSWIYPAFDRLIALGKIRSAYLGIRPWTRLECARLLDEASDEAIENVDIPQDNASGIYSSLRSEFANEINRLEGGPNLDVQVDSVYTRFMGISGTPLRDGYHFGQTITNDYGRPYWTGFNNVTGISTEAVAGPFAFSVRAEYQHSPSAPSDAPQVLAATAAADFTPELPNGRAQVDRIRLLDAMVAFTINNVQFSFGKQSEWLAPNESGPLLLSDNAESFPMFKIDSVSPFEIPLLSKLIGRVRTQFFIGQLSGQHWEYCPAASCSALVNWQGVVGPNIDPQPFIHGEKISFKPTRNLELGMGVTAMFGGPGLPVTWHNFISTYYVHSANPANNPGKRSSAFDFTYRVPGLRDWLTVYGDSLVVDEISPIGSSRPTLNFGVYLPKIPKVRGLDLRAEVLRTAHTSEFPPGFVYFDFRRYRSGYTNNGNLLASWIGRAGRGGQAWATYWISPRTKIQLGYRLQMVYKDFVQGGRLTDYSVRGEYTLGSRFSVSGFVQHEKWWFPILSSTNQSNTTASLQLTFYPHWQLRK
ncbi:MAG TPA: capsule assembly Wzi family protein [Terriglobales bacterium]|nr:capsule assembly Wzi family protein [Terriglobales bacterium]